MNSINSEDFFVGLTAMLQAGIATMEMDELGATVWIEGERLCWLDRKAAVAVKFGLGAPTIQMAPSSVDPRPGTRGRN